MAISSTTFRSRRSSASRVPRSTRTPPASWATASPPPRIWSTPTSVRMPITASVTTVRVTYSPGDGVKNPRAPTYRASGTTRLTARTTPTTASANSTTRSEVLRRARVWCSKNVTATTSAEGDARRLALLGALGRLQLLRLREGEDVGDEVRRERLAADVVLHDGVVVALAGERDAVLGARQLFLDRQHVLVRLELRVGLDHREEPAERARQPRLRLREPAHRLGAARGAGRAHAGRTPPARSPAPLPRACRAEGGRMTTAPRKRILVVDDEPLIIEVLSEHFKPTYDIETALNGTDALTAVLRGRPDVVLLDINMPRMNGVEVLKDIKKIDESIPVIMVTANEQIALAADALKTGAFGYVPKPFDFRYLDHMIAAIFDRPRPAR